MKQTGMALRRAQIVGGMRGSTAAPKDSGR